MGFDFIMRVVGHASQVILNSSVYIASCAFTGKMYYSVQTLKYVDNKYVPVNVATNAE